jgi:MFS transporter, PAT family, beta-lactamase induction signal transducer AmpG
MSAETPMTPMSSGATAKAPLSPAVFEKRLHHPAMWVPTLYTAEGLPFVMVNVVAVLMYKSLGISDARITFFTGLVTIPWFLKPIWGPLIETFRTKKAFVLATELGGGICFGLLALSLNLPFYFTWSLIFFGLIAINSSVHDTAADGVYVTVLSQKEQAQYVGWQGAFYNVGKILSQGGFVWVAGMLETKYGPVMAWSIAMAAFGILMGTLCLWHLRFLPTGGRARSPSSSHTMRTFLDVLTTFFSKRYIWWGIAFLLLYRFAEGQAIKVFPLFMRAARDHGGLGLSTEDVGLVYGIFPPIAFVLGSIAAGYFTAGRGLRKSLLSLCLAFNVPFAIYLALALTRPTELPAITVLVSLEFLGYGFGFVGLQLFMMQQISPGPYRTAHYAFATSIMFLGFFIPSLWSGALSESLGYQHFFVWVMLATVPSFLISWLVPFRDTSAEAGHAAD